VADPSGMDEIAAKIGLSLDQLARLRDICGRYRGPTGPVPGPPGFMQPGDDMGSDLPTTWPLMPWDARPFKAKDKPPPTDAATKGPNQQDTGFPGVIPEDPGVIGNFGGLNQPSTLSIGAFLVQEEALTADEGQRLDQYLTSLFVA
jgi:hypothetical protein